MKKIPVKVLSPMIAISTVIVMAFSVTAAAPKPLAKNVILLIGDGMGAVERQTASYFAGHKLEMDQMPITGMFTTESVDSIVTDSAAAGTAMATGYKTKNGMISVTPDGKSVPTILEKAEEMGLSTGLVATSTITHATPAVFASHVASRASEAEIANQYFNEGVDVLFGGGTNFFLPKSAGSKRSDDRNLAEEFKAKGFEYATDAQDLKAIDSAPALGLFADECLQPDADRDTTDEPSLADMTEKAIDLLSTNSKGFFLMVEGSQIDWAGHANDPYYDITDTLAFDDAVAVARKFAKRNPDTLVIALADHETGGMSMGIGSEYVLNLDALKKQNATGQYIASIIGDDRSKIADAMKEYAGTDNLTQDELNRLSTDKNLNLAINSVMSARAHIGWTSLAHTAVPIPVTAEGANANLFKGYFDNTDIAKKIADAMGLTL